MMEYRITEQGGFQVPDRPGDNLSHLASVQVDAAELRRMFTENERIMARLRAENARLRAALRAARPQVEGAIEYPEHSRDEVLEQLDAALREPGAGAPDRRCENAGCGSGAWLADDDECPACGWRAR